MARTTRTDLPIHFTRGSVSYLCDEDKHQRCTGLVSTTGRHANLCGCRNRDCTCAARVMEEYAPPSARVVPRSAPVPRRSVLDLPL